jgi:hypothetical protein
VRLKALSRGYESAEAHKRASGSDGATRLPAPLDCSGAEPGHRARIPPSPWGYGGSIGETAQGAINKSLTAGFKRSW